MKREPFSPSPVYLKQFTEKKKTTVDITMRLTILVLVSLLACALALKGSSTRSNANGLGRQLMNKSYNDEHRDGGAKKDKNKGGAKVKGNKKADKKKSDKKKNSKEKKCKKAKKAKKERTRYLQGSDSPPVNAPGTDADAALFDFQSAPYCLHGPETAAVCSAMKAGRKTPEGTKAVTGDLNLELSHDDKKSTEEILEAVEDVLRKKTPPKFLGCVTRRLLKGDDADDETLDGDEQSVSVVGVDFMKLKISGRLRTERLKEVKVCASNSLQRSSILYYRLC